MRVEVPTRLAALCCWVIGLWFLILVPLHPNILRGDVADVVLDNGLWKLTHVVMVLVGVASIGVALRLTDGWLLALTIVSGVATAIAGGVEATAFPLLAASSPESLSFDGGLFRSPLFVAITGPWLLLPLCLSAVGWRATAFDQRARTAIAASGLAFFVFGMWFVPIVGPLSTVVFGAVLLWWGWLLR